MPVSGVFCSRSAISGESKVFKASSVVAWLVVIGGGWFAYQYAHQWHNPWAVSAPNFPEKVGCGDKCK